MSDEMARNCEIVDVGDQVAEGAAVGEPNPPSAFYLLLLCSNLEELMST